MNRLCSVLVMVALLAGAIPCFAQQVQVAMQFDRLADSSLSGNYLAKVTVEGAGAARQVVFRLNFPEAYTLDMAPDDIQIVAVRPGADVMSIDANATPTPDTADDTPVVFAEAVAGSPVNGIWIVALMKDEAAKSTKHVCDIVFTSRGRATKDLLAFEAGSVAVKDASLAVLSDQGAFASAQAPLFGDLNWDSKIDPGDYNIWRASWKLSRDVPLADLFPVVAGTTPNDPVNAISVGDNTVNPGDYNAWRGAWKNAPTP